MADPVWIEDADTQIIASAVETAVRGGAVRIAVPGGKTPIPILDRLAHASLDWRAMTFSLTDDREVPSDHAASNFGLLRRALGTTGATLKPLHEGYIAPWDLLWVGMGEDGHVASIFPDPGLDEALPAQVVRLVPDPLPPEAPFARLTQTYAALAATKAMMIVASGDKKRAVLEAAIRGENDLPVARLIRRTTAPLKIYWSA